VRDVDDVCACGISYFLEVLIECRGSLIVVYTLEARCKGVLR